MPSRCYRNHICWRVVAVELVLNPATPFLFFCLSNAYIDVAKIVSDADRIGTLHRKWPMRRAVLYRVERGGNPQDDALILGAARHLEDKFRPPKGYGLRTFFAETAEILAGTYAPVWPALDSNNVARLRRLAGPL